MIDLNITNHRRNTVDGSEIPNNHLRCIINPVNIGTITYQPQLVSWSRISEPSTSPAAFTGVITVEVRDQFRTINWSWRWSEDLKAATADLQSYRITNVRGEELLGTATGGRGRESIRIPMKSGIFTVHLFTVNMWPTCDFLINYTYTLHIYIYLYI